MSKNKRQYFVPKPLVDLSQQQAKLNQLLDEVVDCVHKKVSDPKMLDKFTTAFKSDQPRNLKGGQLKDYQKEALSWMIELSFKKINGILADDMGLGKTIQTIAFFAYLKQEHGISGKHLIICPLTVCNNWQRQLKKWFPDLHTQILWGTEQAREQGIRNIVKPRNFDVLITPYHSAVSACNVLKKIWWETFIIDQAHKIKNDQAILTQTVKQFDANFKMLLTGTPLSNNLRQLWSLLNFIMPQIFRDRELFDKIEEGINSHNGDQNQRFEIQCRIAKKFHGLIRPFIMRRTKKDTDLGLPPKTQHTLYVSITKLQLKMYKNYLKYKNVYGQHSTVTTTNSQMTTRKICNHPYLFPQVEDLSLNQYGQHVIQNSGKMIVLDKLLNKLINKQKRKILIFSQFKIQLDVLEDYCAIRDYNYCRLDGDTAIQDRQEMMNAFNQDKTGEIPIFMLSTRAGGLGVNLVGASVVIIYDIDWNPQNDAQAMDRAYRIGQTKPVNVYKMVTQHTIEQRMLQVQKYKLIWDELVIQKGTIMNIKSQDIFSGLNYEKIANMKKGQIFKIQARKDNQTIDQIIKMGDIKDENKYKQIKQKILKQIQQQKSKENFNANPFEDQQINDREGDVAVRKFQGQSVGNQKHAQSKAHYTLHTQVRSKLSFINGLNVPEHHLFTNLDQYKQMLWNINNKKKQLQTINQNQKPRQIEKEIQQIEEKIEEIQSAAFIDWEKAEFNQFIDQEKQELNSKANNIQRLHEIIPSKSMSEIKKYKQAFYERNFANIPKLNKLRKEVIKQQQQNKEQKQCSEFINFLKQGNAVYNKPRCTVQNMLNNLRIQSGIKEESEFLQSKAYKQDATVNMWRQFSGVLQFQHYEKRVQDPKYLLKKFFKSNSTYQSALNNPQKQQLIRKQFEERKAKVCSQLSRRFIIKPNQAQNQKQQNQA